MGTAIKLVILVCYLALCVLIFTKRKEHLGKLLDTKKFQLGYVIAWYDMWLGVYRNPDGVYYIMIPMMGITFKLKPKADDDVSVGT